MCHAAQSCLLWYFFLHLRENTVESRHLQAEHAVGFSQDDVLLIQVSEQVVRDHSQFVVLFSSFKVAFGVLCAIVSSD
jgi:hypothetical protein